MSESTLPKLWTSKEVADYLKISEDKVARELENGNLHGFKLGQEWRCSDNDLLAYIEGQYRKISTEKTELFDIPEAANAPEFIESGPFDFPWPQKGGGNRLEHYDKEYTATRVINGYHVTFRIGFGNREAAGKMRRRITLWINNRALVEFAGGNNYDNDELVAGIIRLPNGKQLSPYQNIPSEYKDFRTARYNSIVQGPYASKNLAVVIHNDDLKSMLRHAIIRATWKKLI